jgi:hypothetical protein
LQSRKIADLQAFRAPDIQFSGQTKIYGITADAEAFRRGPRLKAESELTQRNSAARAAARLTYEAAACLRAGAVRVKV